MSSRLSNGSRLPSFLPLLIGMLVFFESVRTSYAFTTTYRKHLTVHPSGTKGSLAFSVSSPSVEAAWNSFGSTLSTAVAFPEELTKVAGVGNEPLVLGGGALVVVALVAIVASASSGNKDATAPKKAKPVEPEPEPIDVSIPYDAAIVLAYQKAFGKEPEMKGECYQEFKKLYLEQAVLEVTYKQKTKAMNEFVSTTTVDA